MKIRQGPNDTSPEALARYRADYPKKCAICEGPLEGPPADDAEFIEQITEHDDTFPGDSLATAVLVCDPCYQKGKPCTMTVTELIEALKTLPPNHKVILAKDGEGNSYSPLAGHWEGQYIPTSTWAGEAVNAEDGAEFGYEADNAVILTPIN